MALWNFSNLKNIQAIGNQPNTNQYAIGNDVSSYIPNQEFVQNILTEKQVLEPSVNPKTKVGFREKMGNVLSNALLGRQEAPTEYVDLSGIDTSSPEFLENTGGIVDVSISKNPKVGGLLPDIAAGYRENRTTPISLDNFGKNTLEDGRNKGFAYKLGEGLGSFARFAESPLGRSLLMGSLVGATGGSGLQALAYGGGAGLLNQQSRMKDKLYRDNLIRQRQDALKADKNFQLLDAEEQQAMLDDIANEINSIRGYLGDTSYKNMVNAQIAQDNADYKRLYFDTQKKNQEIDNLMAQQRFDYQQKQDARKLALDWEKLKADKEKRGTATFSEISSMRKEFSGIPAIKNYNEIKRQVGNVTNTYNAYKSGKLKANAADQTMVTTLNKILDPTSVVRESEFARTAAGQSLLERMEGYANKMTKGGGGLTDAEREDLYNAMMEMYKANEDEANAYIQSYTDLANRYGINPADIMPRQYYQSSQPASTGSSKSYAEGTIIKDKQGNRLIMRGGQWQAI